MILLEPMNHRPVSRATVSLPQRIETNQSREDVGDVLRSKRFDPEASGDMTIAATIGGKVEKAQSRRASDPTEIEGLTSELPQERWKTLHLAAQVEALVEERKTCEKKACDDELRKLGGERSLEWGALSKPVARVDALETANATQCSASEVYAELARQRAELNAVSKKVRQVIVGVPATQEVCVSVRALTLLYICLSLCLCVCLFVSLSVYLCLSVCLSVRPPLSLPACLCLCVRYTACLCLSVRYSASVSLMHFAHESCHGLHSKSMSSFQHVLTILCMFVVGDYVGGIGGRSRRSTEGSVHKKRGRPQKDANTGGEGGSHKKQNDSPGEKSSRSAAGGKNNGNMKTMNVEMWDIRTAHDPLPRLIAICYYGVSALATRRSRTASLRRRQ